MTRRFQKALALIAGTAIVVASQVTPAEAATTLPAKIDFGPAGTVAAGYTADSGDAFTSTRGYGWESMAGAPMSLSAETRTRGVNADRRLDTIIHMESGRAPEGRWQMTVPNGNYKVVVGVGDPAYTDSRHVVRAEGAVVVELTPSATEKSKIGEATVAVKDGKLTLDQVGGKNTKIAFVDVTATTDAPVAPTPQPSTGGLAVSGPQDYLGLGTRMVFSTVDYNAMPEQQFTLTNTGAAAMKVTGLHISGRDAAAFKLGTTQAPSFSIPAGGTAAVKVRFTPTRLESNQGILSIFTDTAGTKVVSLGGMNAFHFEDVHEPSVQAIFDSLGYNVRAGVTNERTNYISSSRNAVGDEQLTPYFKWADKTKPIVMQPLAHYGSRGTKPTGPFGINARGSSSSRTSLMSLPGGSDWWGGENQKILPKMTAGSRTNFTLKDANSTFGFWTAHTNIFSDDKLNRNVHAMRVYPALDANRQVIPNMFLIAIDSGTAGKNWDYQDEVFMLSNVTATK